MTGDLLWAAVALCLVGCEVAARTVRRSWPAFVQLVGWLRARPAGWVLLLAVWLWLGWHVFGR